MGGREQPYWRPKLRKLEGNWKDLTELGAFRLGLVYDWQNHAYLEHSWGESRDIPDIRLILGKCPDCAAYLARIHESEVDTPDMYPEVDRSAFIG